MRSLSICWASAFARIAWDALKRQAWTAQPCGSGHEDTSSTTWKAMTVPPLGRLGDNIAGHALTFPALDGYLRTRIDTVMSLWAECKEALGGKSDFVPIVNMGGVSPDQAAVLQALDGVDVGRALDAGIPNELLDCQGYSLDGLVLARAVHDLQRLVNDRVPIREGLRLIPPQVITSADVAGQIGEVRALGIDRVSLYNYGLMRLANLRAAKQALA